MNAYKALSIEIEKKMKEDPTFEQQLMQGIEIFLNGEQKEKLKTIAKFDREYFDTQITAKSPNDISARVFYWGVQFKIPNQALYDIGVAIATGSAITGFSTITGAAAPYIALAITFINLNYSWAKAVNRGNGVYLSMNWLAVGFFVPTAI